ncbi:MAG: GGDEF domain-containing protein [Oscillospiraceae bacterium]
MSALFLFSEIKTLAYINIGSVIIYSLLLFGIKKSHYRTITIIVNIEISINVVVSTMLLSWNGGFYFYLLATTPLAFYTPFKRMSTKLMLSVFQVGVFFTLYGFYMNIHPLTETPDYLRHSLFIINSALCFLVLIVLSYMYAKTVQYENNELSTRNKKLQELADTDPLTGLLNRRSMLKKLEEANLLYSSEKVNYVIIMGDIDNFKNINDKYSHDGGDYVLKSISKTIRQTLRKDDIICRWGGEEILILLPETALTAGVYVGEKIRSAVEKMGLVYNNLSVKVTITLGIAASTDNQTVSSLIDIADRYMYKGKSQGKNCVVFEN